MDGPLVDYPLDPEDMNEDALIVQKMLSPPRMLIERPTGDSLVINFEICGQVVDDVRAKACE